MYDGVAKEICTFSRQTDLEVGSRDPNIFDVTALNTSASRHDADNVGKPVGELHEVSIDLELSWYK